ncbi:MAG: MBL fold metallo-hydrolase [Nitrososphaeraceae archaeon]|nr:MBL fold metallo-hydrolase [Nitrososphaeraceae archaeon]
MEINNVKLEWLGHDGYKIITSDNLKIYIDPYKLDKKHNKKDAGIILISHNHFDHLSPEDLRMVRNENSLVIAAKECVDKLKQEGFKNIKEVEPGEIFKEDGISIEVVPAYNVDKNFHPKVNKNVGFNITVNDISIYHCGDTDVIPEMKNIKTDIALVPVSGVYVMNAEEAALAVNDIIKPSKFAIPMHYGSIVGSEEDAIKFKKAVRTCDVLILNKE